MAHFGREADMPRRAGPWFRKGRGWFASLPGGKQINLGISQPAAVEAAVEAFRKLLLSGSGGLTPPPATTHPPPRTVADAVEEFLKIRAPRVTTGTLRGYRFALSTHLVASFGPRPVQSLTAPELEDWADRPGWSSSTRHNYLGTVGVFLRWAGHPLALQLPPKESRGADAVLSDEQFARVVSAYSGGYGGDLVALLRTLRETGARPGELTGLTVEVVDWSNGCVRLKQHKTKKRTGRDRVIYFPAAAMLILVSQRARHGSGLLFRTRAGTAYTGKSMKMLLQRISKRVGFRVFAYGERHGFATRALCSGVPDAVVAELLGHTSTAMVTRNYGHLGSQSRVLRDAAEKVSRAG
jgi:integrase